MSLASTILFGFIIGISLFLISFMFSVDLEASNNKIVMKLSQYEVFCPNYIQTGSMAFPKFYCPDENEVGREFKCETSRSNNRNCFWLESEGKNPNEKT